MEDKDALYLMNSSFKKFEDISKKDKRLNVYSATILLVMAVVLYFELFHSMRLSYLIASLSSYIPNRTRLVNSTFFTILPQLILLAVSIILLFPFNKTDVGLPSGIYSWCVANKENDNENTLKLLFDYSSIKYESVRNDYKRRQLTFLIIFSISITLIIAYFIMAIILTYRYSLY